MVWNRKGYIGAGLVIFLRLDIPKTTGKILCAGGKGVSLLAAVWDEYLHGQDRYIAR